MTTATITRKTRNFGFAHTDFGTREYNAAHPFIGPDYTGTPKTVMSRMHEDSRKSRSGGMILTGDSACFLGDRQIEVDELFHYDLDRLVEGEVDSITVNLK